MSDPDAPDAAHDCGNPTFSDPSRIFSPASDRGRSQEEDFAESTNPAERSIVSERQAQLDATSLEQHRRI